ncbi:phosphoenolpyruvate synthase [Chitinophaga alhagiae]|uniref:phosphoenolpyruvate synthase n=1 Tax=Chitinophaga alhagiae TaxID=2203219 RepID=UPI001E3A958E|nr:phosphoenolpyruvate synthase [Chitinophaga alhagiae]
MMPKNNKNTYVIRFQELDRSMLMLAGGKGANLGELYRIKEIPVPAGFCVTTEAYQQVTGNSRALNSLLDELAGLKAEERENIREVSAKARTVIEEMPVPEEIAAAVMSCLLQFGEEEAYAIRSSATAEDLPTASFAGQQDTYLNISGKENILRHIRKCWASLFTERAVTYRIRNGFDHRKVQLAVMVQKMVFPQVAGILFTADPVTSNRKVLSIDASFGLGEALVAGLVNADNYKVRNGKVTDKKISAKKLAVYAVEGGGTKEQEVGPAEQHTQALTDEQALQLARIGRKIEAHFGGPQDIEWCLADGTFYIVQSRPITTLFPVPAADDGENHVYISVGHQQMMTDPIKPLGLSFYLLLTHATMRKAGGRLFVDVTPMLATPSGRENIMNMAGKSDPLVKDALMTVMARKDFVKLLPDSDNAPRSRAAAASPGRPVENAPAIVAGLISSNQAALAASKQHIQAKSGPALFDLILEDVRQLQQILFNPQNLMMIMGAIDAATWINEKMKEWLGEKNVADILTQSVPNNVTSEMGLALLDVADALRPYPAVIDHLQHTKDDNFLEELEKLEGGQVAREAIQAYLDKYGMRCVGEIDIARPRWSEKPAALVPMILSNIRNFEPGEGKRKFEQGLAEASKKERELLERLRQLPDGEEKAAETKRMIGQLRDMAGYREYPKYSLVNRYYVYKQALLKEAEQLVRAGVMREREDAYYLAFEEFKEVVLTGQLDDAVIQQRKAAYREYEKLTPPRVITSDGEVITGRYAHDHLPAGAIAGLPVSAGVIEGRARVILHMEEANLEAGDILVTAFTDPSWTPLFVSVKGLVTEVGGLMTHGAVIAREYGLPAVVGVERATMLIKDGQRIRVNGTDGYVEVL